MVTDLRCLQALSREGLEVPFFASRRAIGTEPGSIPVSNKNR